jgi:hypothetical protein
MEGGSRLIQSSIDLSITLRDGAEGQVVMAGG